MKKNNTYILIFLVFIGFITIVSYWDSIQESFARIGAIQETPVDLASIEKMIEEERNKPCEHKKFTTLLDYIEGFNNDNKISLDMANDLSNKLYTMYSQKIKQEARQSLSTNLNDQNRIVNCLVEIGRSSFAHNDNEYNFYLSQYKNISSYVDNVNSYTSSLIANDEMKDEIGLLNSNVYNEAVAFINNFGNINADFRKNKLVQNAKENCLTNIENYKESILNPQTPE
jgi:hypothetical protein